MPLEPPRPRLVGGRRPEDRQVIPVGVAHRVLALLDDDQIVLERTDPLDLLVSLVAEPGLQQRRERGPLRGRHRLDRKSLALARHEMPVQALLGLERERRLRLLRGIERLDERRRGGPHPLRGIRFTRGRWRQRHHQHGHARKTLEPPGHVLLPERSDERAL